jgi:hypothetical protein
MGISAEMGKLCRFLHEMRRNRHTDSAEKGRVKCLEPDIWLSTLDSKLLACGKRVRGIEPPPKAWEAFILPLNYTRERQFQSRRGESESQAGDINLGSRRKGCYLLVDDQCFLRSPPKC